MLLTSVLLRHKTSLRIFPLRPLLSASSSSQSATVRLVAVAGSSWKSNQQGHGSESYGWRPFLVSTFFGSVLVAGGIVNTENEAGKTKEQIDQAPNGKPFYRKNEIAQHKTKDKGIWITYENGVYDITKFIVNHPGGQDKIALAAGGAVEPFWTVYRQHYNSKLPMKILEPLLIGYVHPDDYVAAAPPSAADDPYRDDPAVSPVQVFYSKKPVNSETPSTMLSDSWITPEQFWFKRNHHPVPHISADDYRLTITGLGLRGGDLVLSLDDIKTKFPKVSVAVAIQCGGNRRSEMNEVSVTAGSPWTTSAISNAEWSGARLRDVLKVAILGQDQQQQQQQQQASQGAGVVDEEALMEQGVRHVQFAAAEGLEASIPLHKALSIFGDVVLAYEMNGEALPAGHGFPIRVVVPGHVGIRNVKWLSKITLSDEEAHGPWQRGMAYKGFGPSLRSLEGVDVERIPSLQEQPVQSAVMLPKAGAQLTSGVHVAQGYAYSGGGRGIVRVDVSSDGGETWKNATLRAGSEQPMDRAWAWTFWDCEIEVPAGAPVDSTIQIICKATDASYNVQPDTVKGIWNLRGINNNAWHRVNAKVVAEEEEQPEDDEETE